MALFYIPPDLSAMKHGREGAHLDQIETLVRARFAAYVHMSDGDGTADPWMQAEDRDGDLQSLFWMLAMAAGTKQLAEYVVANEVDLLCKRVEAHGIDWLCVSTDAWDIEMMPARSVDREHREHAEQHVRELQKADAEGGGSAHKLRVEWMRVGFAQAIDVISGEACALGYPRPQCTVYHPMSRGRVFVGAVLGADETLAGCNKKYVRAAFTAFLQTTLAVARRTPDALTHVRDHSMKALWEPLVQAWKQRRIRATRKRTARDAGLDDTLSTLPSSSQSSSTSALHIQAAMASLGVRVFLSHHAPPCIQRILQTFARGHPKHPDRRSLVSFLHGIGLSDDVTCAAYIDLFRGAADTRGVNLDTHPEFGAPFVRRALVSLNEHDQQHDGRLRCSALRKYATSVGKSLCPFVDIEDSALQCARTLHGQQYEKGIFFPGQYVSVSMRVPRGTNTT